MLDTPNSSWLYEELLDIN